MRPVPILRQPCQYLPGQTPIPLDLNDPRSREPLVELRTLGVRGENYYHRADGANAPYNTRLEGSIPDLLLRDGAALRLVRADRSLQARGLRLFVMDAYRPIATQRKIWDFMFDHFRRSEPPLTPREVEAETLKFVSDPRSFDPADPQSTPLHATGGAVDLTLTGLDGEAIDMGTPFDDPSERADLCWFEEKARARELDADDPRLLGRRILYWSLRDVGFTNYPREWWHYDLGNAMHILALRMLGGPQTPAKAWYGYVEPPAP